MARYRYRPLPDPPKVSLKNYPRAAELFTAGFTTRVRNALIRDGRTTLDEVERLNWQDLWDIRGFGRLSLLEYSRRMRELGRTLDPDLNAWLAQLERDDTDGT